jgi:hypothetical protein
MSRILDALDLPCATVCSAPMHGFLTDVLSLADVAVWWISILVIGLLWHKFKIEEHCRGWKLVAALILGLALAGACTVIAAPVF